MFQAFILNALTGSRFPVTLLHRCSHISLLWWSRGAEQCAEHVAETPSDCGAEVSVPFGSDVIFSFVDSIHITQSWSSTLNLPGAKWQVGSGTEPLSDTRGTMESKGLLRCKIVVVGDAQCGKTALLHVFAKDSYPEVRTTQSDVNTWVMTAAQVRKAPAGTRRRGSISIQPDTYTDTSLFSSECLVMSDDAQIYH